MNSVNIAETLNTILKVNAHLDFLCGITKNLPENVKDKYFEYLTTSVEAEIQLENLLKTVQFCEKPEPTTSLH